MSTILNSFAINQLSQGNKIYAEGEKISTICLIIKGRVLVQSDGFKTFLGSGNFIGIADVYAGRILCDYIAYDDVTLYPYDITDTQALYKVLTQNKDFAGLMVAGLSRCVVEAKQIFKSLNDSIITSYQQIQKNYRTYMNCADKFGKHVIPIDSLEELEEFPFEGTEMIVDINYMTELSKVPVDTQKSFFGCSSYLAIKNIEKLVEGFTALLSANSERTQYISQLLEYIVGKQGDAFLYQSITLDKSLHNMGKKCEELDTLVDELINTVTQMEELITKRTGRTVYIDREMMEREYTELITGVSQKDESDKKDDSEEDYQKIGLLFQDSLKKILEYSKMPPDSTLEFRKYIMEFKNLSDKYDTSDEARKIRRGIAKFFYQLYQAVFMRAYEENCKDKIIELFLSYGFVDETLLTKKQLVELYKLKKQQDESIPCKIYNIREWLVEIYEGRKEPSKNEFDLDYAEYIRENKKTYHYTPEEEKALLNDQVKKLNYEIINMFQSNNRLVNGQVSTFVPILYEDLFTRGIATTHVTGQEVNYQINQLRQIDFSVFYREALYYDKEKGIEKEYIQKEVFPDIILLPTSGSKGIMWQEITGKKRDSSGRFLLPSFAEVDVKDMLVSVFGRFRWELCRSIQGTAWNNIKYKSLTSEYVDYIQFYKKNHDLSVEAKERVKVQIQKGKNNSREVFVIDYINWIKNESIGAIRLNKVARELMAMYCPFRKEIREKLSGQPLFSDAMNRFNRENHKKIHELQLRYKALEKEGIALTPELVKTQEFYTNL